VSDWATTVHDTLKITVTAKPSTPDPAERYRNQWGWSFGATPIGTGKMPLYTGTHELRVSASDNGSGGYDITASTGDGNMAIVGYSLDGRTINHASGSIANTTIPQGIPFWVIIENPDGKREWVEVDPTDGVGHGGDQTITSIQKKNSKKTSTPIIIEGGPTYTFGNGVTIGTGPYCSIGSTVEAGAYLQAGILTGESMQNFFGAKLYSPTIWQSKTDDFDTSTWTKNSWGAGVEYSYRITPGFGVGLQGTYFKRSVENPEKDMGDISLPTPDHKEDIFSAGITVHFW
jgi:hypothetical protein